MYIQRFVSTKQEYKQVFHYSTNMKYKVNNRELENYELEKLLSFIIHLTQHSALYYRGENYDTLKTKLNIEDKDYNDKLSSYIFLLGEKGKVYRKDVKDSFQKGTKIFPINSTDDVIFEYIFDKLNRVIQTTKNEILKSYFDKEVIFKNFFSDKKNKIEFIKRLQSISNLNSKLKVRDYYLKFLHRIGNIGFSDKSFYLSSSRNFSIAKKFATFNDKGIVFISWGKSIFEPYPTQILKELDLPRYVKEAFPLQREVTLTGGLIPHYILGFYKVDEKDFIVNPNLFSTEKSFNQIMLNGFDINQSYFHEALEQTNYSGFIVLDENDNYFDINFI